jgi:putative addiction module killer protein
MNRIYFGQDGDTLVVLLYGGSKGSQKRDVDRAKACWKDYRS